MSNKLLLAVIAAAILLGAVCGYALKSVTTPNTVIIPGETKTEVVIRKVPVNIVETKYLTAEKMITDSIRIPSEFSFADSVKGNKDSVDYRIRHEISRVEDSVKSRWDVSINSLVKEYVKEKLVVELKEVEVPKPLLYDGWFWSTVIAVPLLLMAIIF